jgi:hypothetical protein
MYDSSFRFLEVERDARVRVPIGCDVRLGLTVPLKDVLPDDAVATNSITNWGPPDPNSVTMHTYGTGVSHLNLLDVEGNVRKVRLTVFTPKTTWIRTSFGQPYLENITVVQMNTGPSNLPSAAKAKFIAHCLPHLAELNDLQLLFLGGWPVTDRDLKHIGKIRSLRVLELDNTNITDKGLMQLTSLSGLRELSVEYSGVTKIGVRRLQRHLPLCEIRSGFDER